jgi:anti-sigma28 factor (negative regulator of flagellin synthesis)
MNKFYLDFTFGKNLPPRRLEQDVSSKKNSENQPVQQASFQEVLKSVAGKPGSSSEVRQDLVNKHKASLANGTYEVKAQELAEKMIQKIRENKTRELL